MSISKSRRSASYRRAAGTGCRATVDGRLGDDTCWTRPARRASLTRSVRAPVVSGHTSWQRVIEGARITHFPRHWLSETACRARRSAGATGPGAASGARCRSRAVRAPARRGGGGGFGVEPGQQRQHHQERQHGHHANERNQAKSAKRHVLRTVIRAVFDLGLDDRGPRRLASRLGLGRLQGGLMPPRTAQSVRSGSTLTPGVTSRPDLGRIDGRDWGLIWLMFALKIPLAGLIYIVWWAIKQEPDETSSHDDDGGIRRHPPHPRKPFPRHPRRGPHGDPAPPSPPRVRTARARTRTVER